MEANYINPYERIFQELNLIRKEIKEFKELSKPIIDKPEPQEGNIDFAAQVIQTMSKSKIYKLTSENAIPHRKRGGRTLWFNRAELEQWLADGMPHFGEQQASKKISDGIKK